MIKVGDKVECVWDDRTISAVTIIHVPQGAGDLWQIKSSDGRIHAINPYSPDFIRFSRYESVEEKSQNA